MSKNPPLTEDQIRQSAEAEARHAATQAPRPPGLHDRAAEAAAGRRRARDDRRLRGDRFKAAASKIEDSAHRAIEEQDRQVREVGEEISQLVISSRSIGDQIAAGSIPSGEALERLADFHEQHRRIVARTQSIKALYERQLEIAKDPCAAVDDLRRRFPALNL